MKALLAFVLLALIPVGAIGQVSVRSLNGNSTNQNLVNPTNSGGNLNAALLGGNAPSFYADTNNVINVTSNSGKYHVTPANQFVFQNLAVTNLSIAKTNVAPASTTVVRWHVVTNELDGLAYAIPLSAFP